jgi:hypothetical protein
MLRAYTAGTGKESAMSPVQVRGQEGRMLSRRDLLTSAAFGSSSTLAGTGAVQDTQERRRTNELLEDVRDDLREEHARCAVPICAAVGRLRALQRSFLKTDRKFPDFVEVGIDIWERVQDWQLETRQSVALDRRPDGRYTLAFGPTTLLLRPDAADDFLGFPFDE